MITVISFFIGAIAAFIAYRTYRHQQGELIISFINLPKEKSIKDDIFEENIGDVRLKITNASNFPISIDSVYCILGNPEFDDIFSCNLNDSFTRKLSDIFSKNVLIETELNEFHVNVISKPVIVESSKFITIALTPDLIGENLCYKFIDDGECFCLIIKNIYMKNESGKKWELSSLDVMKIQEFTGSLYNWKLSRKLIESIISYYKSVNKLSGEVMTDKELRAKAIEEAQINLGL